MPWSTICVRPGTFFRRLVVADDGASAVGRDVDAVDEPAQLEVTEVERARIVVVDFRKAEASLEQIRASGETRSPASDSSSRNFSTWIFTRAIEMRPLGVEPGVRPLGDELIEDLAEARLPAGRDPPCRGIASAPGRLGVELLQRLVDEAAEPERVRGRLERARRELVVDEPAVRALDPALERARAERLARADGLEHLGVVETFRLVVRDRRRCRPARAPVPRR